MRCLRNLYNVSVDSSQMPVLCCTGICGLPIRQLYGKYKLLVTCTVHAYVPILQWVGVGCVALLFVTHFSYCRSFLK